MTWPGPSDSRLQLVNFKKNLYLWCDFLIPKPSGLPKKKWLVHYLKCTVSTQGQKTCMLYIYLKETHTAY